MPRPSQFAAAALIGAIAAVIVGYFAYAVHTGPEASRSLFGWLFHPYQNDALYWAIAGLLCGAGIRYAFR